MKNAEAAISSRRKGEGREVKSLRNGGVKNFRTGGEGYQYGNYVTFAWEGGQTP